MSPASAGTQAASDSQATVPATPPTMGPALKKSKSVPSAAKSCVKIEPPGPGLIRIPAMPKAAIPTPPPKKPRKEEVAQVKQSVKEEAPKATSASQFPCEVLVIDDEEESPIPCKPMAKAVPPTPLAVPKVGLTPPPKPPLGGGDGQVPMVWQVMATMPPECDTKEAAGPQAILWEKHLQRQVDECTPEQIEGLIHEVKTSWKTELEAHIVENDCGEDFESWGDHEPAEELLSFMCYAYLQGLDLTYGSKPDTDPVRKIATPMSKAPSTPKPSINPA